MTDRYEYRLMLSTGPQGLRYEHRVWDNYIDRPMSLIFRSKYICKQWIKEHQEEMVISEVR
jgi:hypothetical protein